LTRVTALDNIDNRNVVNATGTSETVERMGGGLSLGPPPSLQVKGQVTMDTPLQQRLRQLKAEGHGYAKVAAPDFRQDLTDDEREEAIATGIGASWASIEAADE
jgi:hypothetical protein